MMVKRTGYFSSFFIFTEIITTTHEVITWSENDRLFVLLFVEERGEEMISRLFNIKNAAHIISLFALLSAHFGARACCVYIFHQPEKPDLSKLRNF